MNIIKRKGDRAATERRQLQSPCTTPPKVGVVLVLILGVVLIFLSCGSTDPEDNTWYSGISISLTADRNPKFNETTTVTCEYSKERPPPGAEEDTFVTTGYFDAFQRMWEVISPDTTWIDTVFAYESVKHSITVRAKKYGDIYIRAHVIARNIEIPYSTFGDRGIIFFHVK